MLDNAPTYLSFLSASFGTFVNQDVVQQVHHLIQSGGGLDAITGPHVDQIRNTLTALQKYHGDEVLAKGVTTDQIEVCFLLGNHALNKYIIAISVGAVFFGANTYIGNAPNFMVKSIAEHQHVRTPTFLGYVFKYTLPFMLPMLLVIWWLYFRN